MKNKYGVVGINEQRRCQYCEQMCEQLRLINEQEDCDRKLIMNSVYGKFLD